jgi:hypothetical protein
MAFLRTRVKSPNSKGKAVAWLPQAQGYNKYATDIVGG